MCIEYILLLQEYFRDFKCGIPTVQLMELRVYLVITAFL